MADDDSDSSSRVISLKEAARMARKKAYQRAKALRNADPKYLAMKEAAKAKRREIYRAVKEKHKAETSTQRAAEKKQMAARKSEERAARDGELRKLVLRAVPSPPPRDMVANDVPESGESPQTEQNAKDTPEEPRMWVVREPVNPYDVN